MADERWQVGDQCYPTELAAAQATAAASNGLVLSTSSGVFSVQVGNITETSIHYILANISTGAQSNRIVPFTALECQLPVVPAEVTPEMTMGMFGVGFGAVLSLWAVGYVIGLATGLIRKA